MREWKATLARGSFSGVIDAAVAGTPQLVRRRDGKAVVVISEDCYRRMRPNLRDYLLNSGYAEDHDEFDDALASLRDRGGVFPAPKPGRPDEDGA